MSTASKVQAEARTGSDIVKEKGPHCCGLFCITSLGIRLRQS
jgi:hypothetical protein